MGKKKSSVYYAAKKERRRAKKQQDMRNGFFIHLAVYLFVNRHALLSLVGMEGGSHSAAAPFFWGIGLFFHFLQVFGSSRKQVSGALPSAGKEMEDTDANEALELRPLQKSWSEKDLV